jgi:hypothetical protein
MELPKQPKQGDLVRHFAEESIKWMRSNTLTHVKGGRLKRSPNGTTLEIEQQNGNSLESIIALLSHPWKCTANGDATIYVGEGRIHSYLDGDTAGLASNSMAGFGDWAGGDVTVTAATGVIYGEILGSSSVYPLVDIIADSAGESGDVNITLLRTMPDLNEYITVGFAATMPRDPTANIFYWEIAQVALTDGIASITKQVLRHDPMLWSFTQSS